MKLNGRVTVLSLLLTLIGCGGGSSSTAPAPNPNTPQQEISADSHGGSVWTWINSNRVDVLQDYATQKSYINQELQQAYGNGQRKLSFVLYFSDGQSLVLYPNSSPSPMSVGLINGQVPAQVLTNIHDVLAQAKTIGFNQVLFCFSAKGANFPGAWSAWSESYYQENLSVIESVRAQVIASGMNYLLDLDDEGLTNMQGQNRAYDVRLWQDYVAKFGARDSVGMSGDAGAPGYAAVKDVFGANPPAAIDLHIYDSFTNSQITSYFQSLQATFKQQGYGNVSWIIGETLYNDAVSGAAYQGAVAETNAQVLFLVQWPIARGMADDPNLYPTPTGFANYLKAGF